MKKPWASGHTFSSTSRPSSEIPSSSDAPQAVRTSARARRNRDPSRTPRERCLSDRPSCGTRSACPQDRERHPSCRRPRGEAAQRPRWRTNVDSAIGSELYALVLQTTGPLGSDTRTRHTVPRYRSPIRLRLLGEWGDVVRRDVDGERRPDERTLPTYRSSPLIGPPSEKTHIRHHEPTDCTRTRRHLPPDTCPHQRDSCILQAHSRAPCSPRPAPRSSSRARHCPATGTTDSHTRR